MTNKPLDNPVYTALCTGDAAFANGNGQVKYFHESVSPFAGFPEDHEKGFEILAGMLPAGRKILYATRLVIDTPLDWELIAAVNGVQFIFDAAANPVAPAIEPVLLAKENVEEMVNLATLTKPGPFASRTIEFGHYYGIFEKGRLASMTGQRLHVGNYTEISAVCTHPDFLGRGYAASLMQHQLNLIREHNQIPFLHVRADNERAISLYERLGGKRNGVMNFYFMKKR